MSNKLYALDMFCGAGGFSEGLARAAASRGLELKLAAVDKWDLAIETHAENHPKAEHYCMDVADMDATTPLHGRRLDILIASPECTHHSLALKGNKKNAESRDGALEVLRIAMARGPRVILIENVPRFRHWGPLDRRGRVIKSKLGETFRAFIKALTYLGYKVDTKELVAADYGNATTRERLFVQAVLGQDPVWPAPTHSRDNWVPARAVIDFDRKGRGMYSRRVAPKPATWGRVRAGLLKFGGVDLDYPKPKNYVAAGAKPFLIRYYGTCTGAYSIDLPLGTITTKSKHALAVPTESDIELRVLQPYELAAAMGFGDYRFLGHVQDRYKQIGNAVAVGVAEAVTGAIIDRVFTH